ncbi:hypothetical protein [Actinokineospora terrae]|uniref:Uncharacterized protein n=1 Tax=Actinokineospora terrae TaxID=155974 RepID=A0A1H9XKX2_9PSEU|nr:hypothetical protein [Actinokineospora terrae]SES46838.1 hypothetical protein SAMN04487818_116123 [Actinokineospora terrae]
MAADYFTLVKQLDAAITGPLKGYLSQNVLAGKVERSSTTVGKWLREGVFPDRRDDILALVAEVRRIAERQGLALEVALDEGTWRAAYDQHRTAVAAMAGVAGQAGRARKALADDVVGKPVAEYAVDPLLLGVRPAIDPGRRAEVDSPLPSYVRRQHDEDLAEVVRAAVGGQNKIAVLVGDPGTGKTRACWEAVRELDDWLVWHPNGADPGQALVAGLRQVRPNTVIWLNETQRYLHHPETAARLAELLTDQAVAPVLVLGTLWPDRWAALTAEARHDGDDPNFHTRDLLRARTIPLPAAFTPLDPSALRAAAQRDPRIARAVAEATDREITQYLAGIPVLVERYRNATPAVRALLWAAIDARRLGVSEDIPITFLEAAAPGYLSPAQWSLARQSEDWFQAALDTATEPARGVLGPLTLDPDNNGYVRLAPHLEELGATERRAALPPAKFWAANTHLAPPDTARLAWEAQSRGLYRVAVRLLREAVLGGASEDAYRLHRLVERVDPQGVAGAREWLAAYFPVEGKGLRQLASTLHHVGDVESESALVLRAAQETPLADAVVTAEILDYATRRGFQDAVHALLDRDLVANTRLSKPRRVCDLIYALMRFGEAAVGQARTLAQRCLGAGSDHDVLLASRELADEDWWHEAALQVVRQASPTDLWDSCVLLGAVDIATLDVADRVDITSDSQTCQVLNHFTKVGAEEPLAHLLDRLRRLVPERPPEWPLRLRDFAVEMSCADSVVARLPEPPDDIDLDLDNTTIRHWFLKRLTDADPAQRVELSARLVSAARELTNPNVLIGLLSDLTANGPAGEVATVLGCGPALTGLDLRHLVRLLEYARDTGQVAQFAGVTAKLEIASAQTELFGVWNLAKLLGLLVEAEHTGEAATLATRMAQECDLADPDAVATLLKAFGEHGFPDLRRRLLERDPISFPDGFDRFSLKYSAADLLHILTEMGEPALAQRFATRVVTDADAVGKMARNTAAALLAIGLPELAEDMLVKAANSGYYWVFAEVHREDFPYGREPSGKASPPWRWEER